MLHDKPVRGVTFTPDSARLVTVVSDRPAQVWEVNTGQAVTDEIVSGFPSSDPVTSMAYSADGRWLAVAFADSSVRMWDFASGERIDTLTGHTAPVVALAFSTDGTRLASASKDGTARVWKHPYHDGDASVSEGGAAIPTEDSNNAITSLWHTGPVISVAFVGGRQHLATASGAKVGQVWSLNAQAWVAWGCEVLEGRGGLEDRTNGACTRATVGEPVEWPRAVASLGDGVVMNEGSRRRARRRHRHTRGHQGARGRTGADSRGDVHDGVAAERAWTVGDNEGPQHEVTLDSFYIARTEVTNAQYALYMEANPDVPRPPSWVYNDINHPDQPIARTDLV